MTDTPDKVDGTDTPDKVTYGQAAEVFKVSPETVKSWARARLIGKYRRPLDRRTYVSIREIRALREAEPRREEGPTDEQ